MMKADPQENTQAGWLLVFAACIVATTAMLGSLFFSEIMAIPVCKLCWYQRTALYPLVVVLAMNLFPFNPGVIRTAGVLVVAGWLIALFQVLMVAGIIPENVQPCVQGIPCSETHVALFGFLNIPVLSLLTFSLIGILLFFTHKLESS